MSDETAKIPIAACPICGKPAALRHRPFCSRRCALLDLGRWIGGNYRVPASGGDDAEDDQPTADNDDDAPG
ncbi:MAG TPA: DNA gyrase inhibitor YacG [Stellaceae bacterium]|nr:DNA gyrase inhibitor YacG [Stellaceae bacterium]